MGGQRQQEHHMQSVGEAWVEVRLQEALGHIRTGKAARGEVLGFA